MALKLRSLLLGASLGLSLAAPARADDRATATALFDEARRLMHANDFAAACPKLEAAAKIEAGVGTVYNLGDCYEHLGRTASAWSRFREAAGLAAAKKQPDREKAARARAEALEARLVRLKVTVARTPGVTVSRDGEALGEALWGTPIPVDPGTHKIAAAAPQKVAWAKSVVAEAPGATVDVLVPALADAAVVVGPAAPVAAPAPEQAPPSVPRSWQKPLGITLLGVGVAGLATGTILGLVAKGNYADSNQNAACSASGLCTSDGLATRSDARGLGTVSTVIFIAGGALAAGGAVLWIAAPGAPSARVGVGPGSVSGAFTF